MRCFIQSGGLTSFGEIMQALVLAGGRSSRMGRDKSLIQMDGKSLIRITLERLIDSGHSAILVMASDEVQESRQKSSAGELAHRVVWRRDNVPHSGMIGALLKGMSDETLDPNEPLQISPVDSPWLRKELYQSLRMNLANDVDVVVPRDEIIHPLHALLRVDAISRELSPMAGPLKQQIQRMRWRAVDCEGLGLGNLNHPGDLRINPDSWRLRRWS